MDHVVAWCAFFGAWLLFTGPVFQAVLELREEDFEREQLHQAAEAVSAPPPVSPWWLLLPPVWWILRRQRNERYQRAVVARLTTADVEQLFHYVNKANGWLFVGAGAWLIAVSETWALRREQQWPGAVFWIVVVALTGLALLNAVYRLRRTARVVADHAAQGSSVANRAAPRGERR